VVAATLGASLVFLLARTALAEPLAERAGPRLEKLRAGFQENAIAYLLFLRLVPAFPFWLVNLAPAFPSLRATLDGLDRNGGGFGAWITHGGLAARRGWARWADSTPM
jgi:hypothetical protein